jgi:ribosome-associated toxin RatA of RatAB toxin-antitoxin module
VALVVLVVTLQTLEGLWSIKQTLEQTLTLNLEIDYNYSIKTYLNILISRCTIQIHPNHTLAPQLETIITS